MAENVTTSLAGWDFLKNHVQHNLHGGEFIGSQSVIICATAPRASMLGGGSNLSDGSLDAGDAGSNTAIPIGIVTDYSLQQQAQLQPIFEIGSKKKYIVNSGRTDIVAMINRVEYHGPSLLRMLYAYYPGVEKYSDATKKYLESEITLNGEEAKHLPDDIKLAPGYNNFWLNLSSDIFSQPMGILMVLRDNANSADVAATFLENCYIQAHQMSVSSSQVIIAENATITCENLWPVKVSMKQTASS